MSLTRQRRSIVVKVGSLCVCCLLGRSADRKELSPFKFTSTVKEEKETEEKETNQPSSSRGQGRAENKITAELKNNSFRIERSTQ
jgi:hypothetical protein